VGRGSHARLQRDNNIELRRPHGAAGNQSSTGQSTVRNFRRIHQNALSYIGSVSSLNADSLEEKKSLLSPQAAEFVPRYIQQLQSSSQVPVSDSS